MILLTNLLAAAGCVGFVALLAGANHVSIRRSWVRETQAWHGEDITELPRRTPVEPECAVQESAPSVDTLLRVRAGLKREPGAHRIGFAPGTDAQRLAWGIQFEALTRAGWNTDERNLIGRPPMDLAGVS